MTLITRFKRRFSPPLRRIPQIVQLVVAVICLVIFSCYYMIHMLNSDRLLVVEDRNDFPNWESAKQLDGNDVAQCWRERTNFVYIKMIKCASTTLAGVFRRFGILRNLSFVLPVENRIYIGWPYDIDDTLYRPKKTKEFNILCEHAIYNEAKMAALMPSDTVFLTSLREPFAQFKSMLNYYNVFNISGLKVHQNSSVDALSTYFKNIDAYDRVYMSPEASPTRYCIPDGFRMSRNLMSYNLGFPTGFLPGTPDMTNNDVFIQQWLNKITEKFRFVIIVERFYESMVLLRRKMCWDLPDILFQASNELSYGYKKYVDPHLVELYKNWSRVDYALYTRYNASFHEMIIQLGKDFNDEVRLYRNVNRIANERCVMLANATSSAEAEKMSFVVEKTNWNSRFVINAAFCWQLINIRNFEIVQKMYDDQLPKNIEQRPPSKKTC